MGVCLREPKSLAGPTVILIYAHVSSFAQHDVARQWVDRQWNGSTPIGLPWASVLAFLRVVTNPRVFEHPEPIADVWLQVRTWLACETAWGPQPVRDVGSKSHEILLLSVT